MATWSTRTFPKFPQSTTQSSGSFCFEVLSRDDTNVLGVIPTYVRDSRSSERKVGESHGHLQGGPYHQDGIGRTKDLGHEASSGDSALTGAMTLPTRTETVASVLGSVV